jgi:hypothetical protein
MSTQLDTNAVSPVVRDAIARAVAVVALAGVALVHLLDAPGSFQDAPYKGWLYVALILGCLGAAAALVRSSDLRAWAAAAVLPLSAIAAFVISRTVGLPQGTDDIGNWTEPLGMTSLFVGGTLAGLSLMILQERTGLFTSRLREFRTPVPA